MPASASPFEHSSTSAREPQRRLERRTFHTRAQMTLPGRAPIEVRTREIGVDSLTVMAPLNVKPGTECSVALSLLVRPAGRALLDLKGVVQLSLLSSTGYGFLLELVLRDVDSASRDAIASYLLP